MLSSKVLTRKDISKAAHYYENDSDDYYAKDGGAFEWQGKGAKALGLLGNSVDSTKFRQLLAGNIEENKSTRFATRSDNSERIGIDFTFSAPKSVSIQALIGLDEAIIEAHDKAVYHALEIAEQYAETRKKINGKSQVEKTKNLIVCKFRHETSREMDPQLHTHAIIMNLTRRQDGEWRALKNDEIIRMTKYLGYEYRTHLAKELESIGYKIRREPDGMFELEHITQIQLEAFSKRSIQIEDHLEIQGLNRKTATAKQKEHATLSTRKFKLPKSRDVILKKWQIQADELGIDFNKQKMVLSKENSHLLKKDTISELKTLESRPLLKKEIRQESNEIDLDKHKIYRDEKIKPKKFFINGKFQLPPVGNKQNNYLIDYSEIFEEIKFLTPNQVERIFNRYIGSDEKITRTQTHMVAGNFLKMELSTGRWCNFRNLESGNLYTLMGGKGLDSMFNLAHELGIDTKKSRRKNNDIYQGNKYIDPKFDTQDLKSKQFKNEQKLDKEWLPLPLVPIDAPKLNIAKLFYKNHYYNNKSPEIKLIHEYRDIKGLLKGYVIRTKGFDGKKVILPVTYCFQESSNSYSWKIKGFEGKPIYGLEKLASLDKKIVLIVEGEKAADAASKLLPEYTVISWLGGSSSVSKVDWSVLKDRKVIIWPDCDEVGIKAANTILEKLNAIAEKVKMVNPYRVNFKGKVHDNLFPDSWDLADKLPDGIRISNIKEIIDNALNNNHNIKPKPKSKNIETLKVSSPPMLIKNRLEYNIHQIEDGKERWRFMANDYTRLSSEEREKTIIISENNYSKNYINSLIRKDLGLSQNGIEFNILIKRENIKTELKFSKYFNVGDIICPEKNYLRTGLKRDEFYKIEGNGSGNRLIVVDKAGKKIKFNPLTHQKLSVYQQVSTEFTAGDIVRITRTDKKLNLNEGESFKVKEVQVENIILTNNNRQVKIAKNEPLHIDYAYTTTLQNSSRLIFERVLIDVNTRSLTKAKDIYYASISRTKVATYIFTDNAKGLPNSIKNKSAKLVNLNIPQTLIKNKNNSYDLHQLTK